MTTTPGPVSNARVDSRTPPGGTIGDVPDAAQILQCAPLGGMGEQERVGRGYQRRALPGGRNVPHAKVADDADARALGDDRGLAELPRGVTRLVPHRLAVARNRGDRGAIHASLGDGGDSRVREPVTEVEGKPAVLARRDPTSASRKASRCAASYARTLMPNKS
jgi:hypothetical protein